MSCEASLLLDTGGDPQAQSEVLAALLHSARLDEQSPSEGGSVVAYSHEGLCTTHSEVSAQVPVFHN